MNLTKNISVYGKYQKITGSGAYSKIDLYYNQDKNTNYNIKYIKYKYIDTTLNEILNF